MDKLDDRRSVKINENGNIVGVELYDSYVNVKNTQWIVDKLRKSTSEQFYMKFKRCYVNLNVLETMVHHFQRTTESKHRIALQFPDCDLNLGSLNTEQSKYAMENVDELAIDFHHFFPFYWFLQRYLPSLQYITVFESLVKDTPIRNANFVLITQILWQSTTLRGIHINIPRFLVTNCVDDTIRNNHNLESFIVNGRDEILERNRKFIQSVQDVMHLASETSNTHASSITDILLAFVIPLLPYVPRWFSSQEYVKQVRLCNEMFLECNKLSV